MHTALSSKRVLAGIKEQPSALLAHGGKLYVGTATGALFVFSLPKEEPENGSTSEPLQTVKAFSPKGKPIEQLAVIKEISAIVSLSDGAVSLHSLPDLQLLPPSPLPQSKGALTFTIDTSVQRRPKLTSDPAAGGTIGQGTLRRGQAWRIGGTAPKGGGTTNAKLVASLRDMDAIAKEKEERRKALREGMPGLADEQRGDDDTEMTLVTVLVIGSRRKLVFIRWVDGQFWDTKQLVLPHSPRALAFSSPTSLFIGYSLMEYASLKIPFAADSSVMWLHRQDGSSTAREIPETSASGRYVDVVQWDAAKEISLPSLPAGVSNPGIAEASTAPAGYGAALGAAFGSLGGYVGMGGARQRDPRVISIEENELLVGRETMGILLSADGKPTRQEGIEWPITPDSTIFVHPYIVSVLPAVAAASTFTSKLTFGALSSSAETSQPNVQVLSSKTLAQVQLLRLPLEAGVRMVTLPTLSSGAKPPIYICSSPTDRTALETDGTTVWKLEMERWDTQVNELVRKGEFEEAIALLDSIDQVFLEDKEKRRAQVQALQAVHLFSKGKFDQAIEIFLSLDTNPAQVLTLYPRSIAGDLSHPRSDWYKVFGATEDYVVPDAAVPGISSIDSTVPDAPAEGTQSGAQSPARASPRGVPAAAARERTRLGSLLTGRRPQSIYAADISGSSPNLSELGTSPAGGVAGSPSKNGNATAKMLPGDDDTASIRSVGSARIPPQREREVVKDEAHRKSLDALGKFLADRRRIFKPILENHPESHLAQSKSQEHRDVASLLAIPSVPFSSLGLDRLTDVAQVVDTALLKTFLETKPALIGSLCRLENWCKVEQVEGLLMEKKKFSELIALYGGKSMHMKALQLLRKFGEEKEDREEKLEPTIRYLQNLDAQHINVILEASHWVLEEDPELGLEIFTADTGKVSSFPRLAIVQDLESFSPLLCIRYLEFIIATFGESEPALHEKLLFLYLRRATELGQGGRKEERAEILAKLLAFLKLSRQYDAERVLGRLPPTQEDLYEIRAVLLGRIGQHDAALSIYVHILKNVAQAEEYCKRVWSSRESEEDRQVFFTLIKVLLHPEQTRAAAAVLRSSTTTAEKKQQLDSAAGLTEALGIIARHGPRIDAVAVFELLPPLVPMQKLHAFATRVLQVTSAKRHDAQILLPLLQAREHQLDHGLMALKGRSVKITESRLCARCGKRLGNSAGLTVHAVTGSVTHYFCREDGNAVDEAISRRMRLQDLYL